MACSPCCETTAQRIKEWKHTLGGDMFPQKEHGTEHWKDKLKKANAINIFYRAYYWAWRQNGWLQNLALKHIKENHEKQQQKNRTNGEKGLKSTNQNTRRVQGQGDTTSWSRRGWRKGYLREDSVPNMAGLGAAMEKERQKGRGREREGRGWWAGGYSVGVINAHNAGSQNNAGQTLRSSSQKDLLLVLRNIKAIKCYATAPTAYGCSNTQKHHQSRPKASRILAGLFAPALFLSYSLLLPFNSLSVLLYSYYLLFLDETDEAAEV